MLVYCSVQPACLLLAQLSCSSQVWQQVTYLSTGTTIPWTHEQMTSWYYHRMHAIRWPNDDLDSVSQCEHTYLMNITSGHFFELNINESNVFAQLRRSSQVHKHTNVRGRIQRIYRPIFTTVAGGWHAAVRGAVPASRRHRQTVERHPGFKLSDLRPMNDKDWRTPIFHLLYRPTPTPSLIRPVAWIKWRALAPTYKPI